MPPLAKRELGEYLDAVSSASPAPGGGSVAAVVAALAAAVGSMVTAISARGSEDKALLAHGEQCQTFRDNFLSWATDDQVAFEDVMRALRLSKEDETRASQLEACLVRAAEVPLQVARACLELIDLLDDIVGQSSRHCISDIGASAHLANAACRTSLLNVWINTSFMNDAAVVTSLNAEADRLQTACSARSEQVVRRVVSCIRGG